MKTTMRMVLIVILVIGLTNCSSSFFTLSPDEDSKYEMGRKVIEKEDKFAYSSISFEEQTETEFIFYLYVFNKEQNEFTLDPKEIYVKTYDENKKPLNRKRLFAIDPEKQIAQINSDIKERDNTHSSVTGLNIVFSLFDTIVDLSDDEDNDTEEVVENAIIFTGNQINEEVSYQNDIDNLNSQKSYWKNEVVRITQLSKDEEIGGIFMVPINPDANYIKVAIPIGKTVHTYKFKQISH